MKNLRTAITLPLLILGVVFGSAKHAEAATPGDYDGDGKTDAAIIDADAPEDKTSVFVKQSRNGGVRSFVFFPFGDHVISGNFYTGNGRTYPGIINKKGSILEWRIKLSSDPTNIATTSFGNAGDFVFTGDVDGDGCNEIGVISSAYVWSTRSFSGSTVTDITFGQSGDIPLPPADLVGNGTPEFIVVRIEGGRQVAHIRQSDSTETTINLGGSSTTPMVGNFFGAGNNFGWLDRNRSLIVQLTSSNSKKKISGFANPRRGLLRPDGIGISEGKTGRFGSP